MEVGQRDGGSRHTLAQINMTPVIDVMLALLIIFMISAPMMNQGVEVNLPEVGDAPGLESVQEPLIITVTRDGSVSIGKTAIEDLARLTPVLLQVLKSREDQTVFLEADRDVPYGRVVQVMAAIKGAGIEKLGMVSTPPETPVRR